MTAPPAPGGVRAIGELLDRAIHRTVKCFALFVPVCVAADVLGNLTHILPNTVPAFFASWLVAVVVVNRARVVVIATVARPERRGTAWAEVVRHPAALAFGVPSTLELVIPLLAVGIGTVPVFLILRAGQFAKLSLAFSSMYLLGIALGTAIAVLLVVVLLLITLASMTATIDTVLEGTPPQRTLVRWLRQTFRVKSFGPTLLAASVFVLLVGGVPLMLIAVVPLGSSAPWAETGLRSLLDGTFEGMADALAIIFALEWRESVLVNRQGSDIDALLGGCDASVVTASPTVIAPGFTTSQ